MYKVILVLLAIIALLGVAVWLMPEGMMRQLLQFAIAIVLMILVFAGSIGFLQWYAPTNTDGSPRI